MNSSHAQIGTLIVPRHGVVTLIGYGIQVRVSSGHLILEDGIGADRRHARFARVGHGLKRLVVIGPDGMVSLAALRWLADQDAAFVMLDREGKVLTAAGPARTPDGRMRRAQGLALQSGAGLRIARELISQKLAGQEQLVRQKLHNSGVADLVAEYRSLLSTAKDFEALRLIESQAGAAYWSVWRGLSITFPTKDLSRVPEHWREFGARRSPLSGASRLAANPLNAILNYLYAVLESETRLALTAVGLDPCVGFLHADTPNRDSLVFDLLEPVRPKVDAYVLDWIVSAPLKREWFFEQRDGSCRLMASLAERLSETASAWREAVAPLAEWVARTLWTTTPKSKREAVPPTLLTQRRRREVQGCTVPPPHRPPPQESNLCRECGVSVKPGANHCFSCSEKFSVERMIEAARLGRVVSRRPESKAARSESMRRHEAERKKWDPSTLPSWLNKDTYMHKVQPLAANLSTRLVMSTLEVSFPYGVAIRNGKKIPHPRHWVKLAELVGIAPPG